MARPGAARGRRRTCTEWRSRRWAFASAPPGPDYNGRVRPVQPHICPFTAPSGPFAESPCGKPFLVYDFPHNGVPPHGRPTGETHMHAPIKYVEKGLAIAANGAWVVF